MVFNIDSCLSRIEELVASQNADQNIILLGDANLGRSLENEFLIFSIDNPYAFSKDEISMALKDIFGKALKRTQEFAEQNINGDIYFNSKKYCFLLWVCSISIPFNESTYSRVKNIFKILIENKKRLSNLYSEQLKNNNLTEIDKKEFLELCAYVPSFLENYHNNNANHTQIEVIERLQRFSTAHVGPFFFDDSINFAVTVSHFIAKESVKRSQKDIFALMPEGLILMYLFCLFSLHVVSYLLDLNFDRLGAYTCLTLLNTESKINLCSQLKNIFKIHSEDVSSPNMHDMLEDIKNEIANFLMDFEGCHLDRLGKLFSDYLVHKKLIKTEK